MRTPNFGTLREIKQYWTWLEVYVQRCIDTNPFGHIHPYEMRKKAEGIWGFENAIDMFNWQTANRAKIRRVFSKVAKRNGRKIAKNGTGSYTTLVPIK